MCLRARTPLLSLLRAFIIMLLPVIDLGLFWGQTEWNRFPTSNPSSQGPRRHKLQCPARGSGSGARLPGRRPGPAPRAWVLADRSADRRLGFLFSLCRSAERHCAWGSDGPHSGPWGSPASKQFPDPETLMSSCFFWKRTWGWGWEDKGTPQPPDAWASPWGPRDRGGLPGLWGFRGGNSHRRPGPAGRDKPRDALQAGSGCQAAPLLSGSADLGQSRGCLGSSDPHLRVSSIWERPAVCACLC